MKIIDPHVHLFDLTKGNYHWLTKDKPPYWPDKQLINKNFNEDDLALNDNFQLSAFVHIEAGFNNEQPEQELQWLEKTVKQPFKSIAFIDLNQSEPDFNQALDKLLACKSFIGVRYIFDFDKKTQKNDAIDFCSIEEVTAESYLSDKALTELQLTEFFKQPHVIKNFATLEQHQLIFECQMPLSHCAAVNAFMKLLALVPKLKVVINHAGLPEYSSEITRWYLSLQKLSNLANVSIKCSGWEMSCRHYTHSWQMNILHHCIATFGENRVMLASNFPLTLLSMSYQAYWQQLISSLPFTKSIINKLTYTNALTTYGLSS